MGILGWAQGLFLVFLLFTVGNQFPEFIPADSKTGRRFDNRELFGDVQAVDFFKICRSRLFRAAELYASRPCGGNPFGL